jgi:hypothetical protein
MTAIIHYKDLTFPEVDALPRDIPVVIPLGEMADADLIKRVQRQPRSASEPDRVCVFPSVPFGFGGSAFAVDRKLFKRVIDSLVASIKEDGFTNVRVIKHSSTPLRSAQDASTRGDRVALIATGHTEQHAFHLPLNTDTLIIEAIARGVEAKMPDTIFRLPTFPYGVSMHHRQYPGTARSIRAREDLG